MPMDPKRSLDFMDFFSKPKAARFIPGLKTLREAWDLFIFSAIFAVLFNLFYADGIELKTTSPKSFHLQEILPSNSKVNSPSASISGWKNAPKEGNPKASSPSASRKADAIPRLSLGGVKRRFDAQNCVFLDARSKEAYQEGHIPGSLNFYTNEIDKFAPAIFPQLTDKNKEIVVYCSGGTCTLSLELAQTLIQQGYARVKVFEGGFPEWKKAGYHVATGDTP